jgi:hypothetical protein
VLCLLCDRSLALSNLLLEEDPVMGKPRLDAGLLRTGEFADLVTSSACQYDRMQRFFRWSMAAIIFTAIAPGIWALYLDRNNPIKGSVLFVHKSLGLAVLIPGNRSCGLSAERG